MTENYFENKFNILNFVIALFLLLKKRKNSFVKSDDNNICILKMFLTIYK